MKRTISSVFLTILFIASLRAESDTLPPQLLGLTISPSTVDVTLASRQVTFNLHVSDDLSGINFTPGFRINVNLRSPSGSQLLNAAPPDQTGVVVNANLTVTMTIPRYAEPGIWQIDQIRLVDNAGNFSRLSASALAAAGFPISVNIVDATPDFEAPRLSSIAMWPSSIDVSATPISVTVDISVTDDASGFFSVFPSKADFEITSPSSKQSRFIPISDWIPVSGINTNGVWRASFVMPAFSEPGLWKIKSIRLADRVRSTRIYSASELAAAFGPAVELPVTASLFDIAPPQLTNVTYDQAVINTSLGSQTVVARMTITDDLAGASSVSDRVPDTSFIPFSFGGLTLQSPSGAQRVFTNAVPTSGLLVAGTSLNGIWTFDAVFPQFSEEGTWTASVSIKDTTRNVRTYSGVQLAALGFPDKIEIIRPSLQTDGGVDPSGGTVVDDTFGTRAQLIVPPGSFSGSTTVAIDVLQSPVGVPLPSGFSSAETFFVNIQLTPTPSYPLPAPGITVVLPLRNYTIPGTQMNLLRVNTATGMLEPAVDISGVPIIGQVDAGGMTATFSGVARFSTVVGVLPAAITVVIDIKPGDSNSTINTSSKGTVPVAIFSTSTLDLTQIDPSTLHFSGAPVAVHKNGSWHITYADLNADGIEDLIAHFETEQILLKPSDILGLVEGHTPDGRVIRGVDSIRVVK